MPSNDKELLGELLREYQLTLNKWFMLALSIVLIPFDINHFIQGRYLLGAILAAFVGVFLANAASIHRRGRLLVPHLVVTIPVMAMLWLAVSAMGVAGLFWCYPSLLIMHFFLPRTQANVLAVVLIGIVTAVSYFSLPIDVVVRASATLVLTSVFANIFLHTISRVTSRLNDMATVDALTGVFNRRHLEASAQWPIQIKRRYGTPVSMLLVDADYFKAVNDRHGHEVGDRVLKELATRIRSSVRTIDQVFRIGGEEFVVLLPETRVESASRVADKLCRVMRESPLVGGIRITVSIGLAELASDEGLSGLLRRCDHALYEAKRRGRDQICVATATSASTSQSESEQAVAA